LLVVLGVVGCSGQQHLDADDLASEHKALIALTAESALLAHYAAEGRATSAYLHGHADYLRREFEEREEKLSKLGSAGKVGALRDDIAIAGPNLGRMSKGASLAELTMSAERLDHLVIEIRSEREFR